jgi:hypothetical protein
MRKSLILNVIIFFFRMIIFNELLISKIWVAQLSFPTYLHQHPQPSQRLYTVQFFSFFLTT